jgi:hypothetical protein
MIFTFGFAYHKQNDLSGDTWNIPFLSQGIWDLWQNFLVFRIENIHH